MVAWGRYHIVVGSIEYNIWIPNHSCKENCSLINQESRLRHRQVSLLVAISLEFAKVAVSAVACVWSVLVVSGSLRQLGIGFKALTGVTTVVDTSLGGCRGHHKCRSLSIKRKPS
jgi:hypothetical protein